MIIVYCIDENCIEMFQKSMTSYRKYNPTARFIVVSETPLDVGVENIVIKTKQHYGTNRVSNATFLKLYLPQLPFEKIIYVDCDTLCQYPLNELWEMPCDLINICESHDYGKKQAEELGHEKYALAGMMVMNLPALRSANFTEKCLEVEKNPPSLKTGWHQDETCINVAFGNKVTYIDQKWDYCHNREYLHGISEQDAMILHFIGKNKSDMDNYTFYQRTPELLDYLKGKSVNIVGNAQSLFDREYGKEIDKADVVIRFNKGFITQPEKQGTKTSILMLGRDMTKEEIDSYGAEIVVNRSTKYKNNIDYTISALDTELLRNRIRINTPTTGFIAIDICMTANAKSITLYGFDFEKTKTFYNPDGYKTPHNYHKEEELVRLYEKAGILTVKE